MISHLHVYVTLLKLNFIKNQYLNFKFNDYIHQSVV